MRLATVVTAAGEIPAAILPSPDGERALALDGVLPGGTTVTDVLGNALLATLVADEIAASDAMTLPLVDDLRLAPPVRPSKIVCVGYNYRWHNPDGGSDADPDPTFPDIFVKTQNTVRGADDLIEVPRASLDVDYEGEVAVVVGRRMKDVPEADTMSYVGGFAVFNDITDREWQRRTSQWAVGKNFDGFGQLGPVVVTPDEVGDPGDLLVEVERDGLVTVSQSTSTWVFPLPRLLAHLSSVWTLEPGDVIATGSPQKLPGVHATHRPLVAGDAVTITVTGLGSLTTRFVAPETTRVPSPSEAAASEASPSATAPPDPSTA
ncbi:fumarylacetoacetate hydrolase family protein [Sanguibacter sp. HDW7]|uniref:fumarylacetoacetate hydrolase family protein n=1 Tax=Sanguibacter sp. HDW7 TaxID=2714931 RepID=UPI00140DCC6D|nr:fumarylacetoacetate hydrolase family protein [Sanguibacter sp. HDW7]QIK84688.1 fumarylacetoacetate hydrolase family protein [Sanguibacter sp. HDW7]